MDGVCWLCGRPVENGDREVPGASPDGSTGVNPPGSVCPACGSAPAVEVWEDDGDVEPPGLGGYDLGGEG